MATSGGSNRSKPSRPPAMPECLPHASEETRAALDAADTLKAQKSRRRYRMLAMSLGTVILVSLSFVIWVVHRNFGLLLNAERSYRDDVEVFGLSIWGGQKSKEYIGTKDEDGHHVTGTYRIWDEEGRLRAEGHYRDGKPVGTTRQWYDGVLDNERAWDHDTYPSDHRGYVWLHGEYRAYQDGELLARQEYSVNLAEGLYEEYFPKTGALRVRGQCKNNRPVGYWEWYEETGALIERTGAADVEISVWSADYASDNREAFPPK